MSLFELHIHMKLTALQIIFFYFISFVALAQDSPWELAKSDEGVEVFTRKLQGHSLKEFKAVALVNSSVEKLVSILKDADNMFQWLPDCSESRLIERKGSEQYHYTITDAPWPVSDRDGYFQFTYNEIDEGVKVSAVALANYRPEKDGLVRISFAEGYWMFERLDEKSTRVTYQMLVSPGGTIPDWLANSAVVNTPFNTLKNLKAYVIHLK